MSHPHPELSAPADLAPGGLRVIPFGGLGEVGRNMTGFEYDGRLLVVDCGVLFPEDHHPGVDLILPDWHSIRDRLDDIEALVLTHGGCGIVSVVGHVAGVQYAAMVDAVDRGDLASALATYRELVPVVEAVMTTAQGAMTAKAALELLGVLPTRTVRLPLVPADEALVDHLRDVLGRAGLLTEGAA